ncbi:MAG: hypothetical protein IJW25_02210 [Clostridia bacterium]|nr:hypothetical protein [Clostridia bacterium]
MNKVLKYRIFVWIIVVFFIILAPSSFSTPSQIQEKSVVVGIGLDGHEQGLELSAQILIPEPGGNYSQKQVILNSAGKNFSNAVRNLEHQIGKTLGFAHCHIIILSDAILEQNVTQVLDYLMRSNILGNNTTMVHTSGKAKDLLKASSEINNGDINNLETISLFNYQYYTSPSISLTTFYNNYLSPSKTSLMGTVNVKSQQSESGSSSQSGGSSGNSSQSQTSSSDSNASQISSSGGGSESSSSGSENSDSSSASTPLSSSSGQQSQGSMIENKGDAIVIKNGKKLLSLSKEDMRALNWIDNHSVYGEIQIENVSNEKLQDANISLQIRNKKVKLQTKLDPQPTIYATITFDLIVEAIEQKNGEILTTNANYIDEDLEKRIKNFIQNDLSKALELAKEYDYDPFNAYHLFNKTYSTQWKAYLNQLEDPEKYMDNMQIFVDVVAKNAE